MTTIENLAGKVLAEDHGGHWGSHPVHTVEDWKHAVHDGETRLGTGRG